MPNDRTILSQRPDGYGYHYGFAPDDYRQINVRQGPGDSLWRAWVGGERVTDSAAPAWVTKEEAEAAALAWMKAHPVADETYTAIQTTGRKAS